MLLFGYIFERFGGSCNVLMTQRFRSGICAVAVDTELHTKR